MMKNQQKHIEKILAKGIRFNEKGLAKLQEARKSGTGVFPEWFIKDMKNAEIDTE